MRAAAFIAKRRDDGGLFSLHSKIWQIDRRKWVVMVFQLERKGAEPRNTQASYLDVLLTMEIHCFKKAEKEKR